MLFGKIYLVSLVARNEIVDVSRVLETIIPKVELQLCYPMWN